MQYKTRKQPHILLQILTASSSTHWAQIIGLVLRRRRCHLFHRL